jgi:hypothetical protein
MTGNKLYEANHLCMMKIALIKEKNYKKTTTSRYHSSIVKTTSHIKMRRKFQISPLDGAQYANISSNLKQATRENNARYNSKMKNTSHAYSQIKKNSYQSSQSHYYSHFYLKSKQTHADYAIHAAKRTENALGNFMKLSSLPDEST